MSLTDKGRLPGLFILMNRFPDTDIALFCSAEDGRTGSAYG